MRRINVLLQVVGMILILSACGGKQSKTSLEVLTKYAVDSTLDQQVEKDTAFMNLIHSYKSQLDGQMNTVLAHADMDMVKGTPESLLSNFIADAMLQIGKNYCKEHKLKHSVDIAVMNIGGIRSAVSKGEVTTGKMYEMLPFKNKLVIIEMTGKQVADLFNEIASYGGEGIAGVKMGIKNKKAVHPTINGKPLRMNASYHIVSIDYLVNTGIKSFKNRKTFRHMHSMLRSAMIEYIKEKNSRGEHLGSKLDGRIYNVD